MPRSCSAGCACGSSEAPKATSHADLQAAGGRYGVRAVRRLQRRRAVGAHVALRRAGQGAGHGSARRSEQAGRRRRAALPIERRREAALEGWRSVRAARLQGRVRRLGRWRLVRRFRQPGTRRPGLAEDAHGAARRDVLGRQHQSVPLRRADHRRRLVLGRPCGRRNQAALFAAALRRPLDWRDGAYRIPRRHRSRPDPHPRPTHRERRLRPHRHEDLHHQRRARSGREHRPPSAGQAAERSIRQPRHLSLLGAEVSAGRHSQQLR